MRSSAEITAKSQAHLSPIALRMHIRSICWGKNYSICSLKFYVACDGHLTIDQLRSISCMAFSDFTHRIACNLSLFSVTLHLNHFALHILNSCLLMLLLSFFLLFNSLLSPFCVYVFFVHLLIHGSVQTTNRKCYCYIPNIHTYTCHI